MARETMRDAHDKRQSRGFFGTDSEARGQSADGSDIKHSKASNLRKIAYVKDFGAKNTSTMSLDA